MEKAVYKITDHTGKFYIGSSKNPKSRFREHKYSKTGNIDFLSAKLEIICFTKNYAKLEESLIKKELDSKNTLCLNKSWGCFGPKGLKFDNERKNFQSENLKKRWKDPEQKKIFMSGIEKSRKKNNVFEMSKKAHELRWSKMPKYFVEKRETEEIFGPFQGYKKAAEILKIHPDTISENLKGNQNNRTYKFYYSGGVS